MANRLRPLAVGLLHLPVNTTEPQRRRARVSLALLATEEGYALLETYESGGNAVREEAAFSALEQMTTRCAAVAVLCAGDVNLQRARELAAQTQAVVIVV